MARQILPMFVEHRGDTAGTDLCQQVVGNDSGVLRGRGRLKIPVWSAQPAATTTAVMAVHQGALLLIYAAMSSCYRTNRSTRPVGSAGLPSVRPVASESPRSPVGCGQAGPLAAVAATRPVASPRRLSEALPHFFEAPLELGVHIRSGIRSLAGGYLFR